MGVWLNLWLFKAAYHLGIPVVVDSSSLSKANESRNYRIFEELGMWLIRKVRPMYAKENVPDVYLPGWEIFAIDSTTIPCSIKLAGWAIYTMDKAYGDEEALYRMHLNGTYFVTRAKATMKYDVVDINYNANDLVGLVGDKTIHLSGYVSEKKYPEDLRLVEFCDAEKDEIITFITNNFELGSLIIANIYRNRWQIETFFKWIKGNLTIKALWGYSENAVKIELWVAISTYLLLAWGESRTQKSADDYRDL